MDGRKNETCKEAVDSILIRRYLWETMSSSSRRYWESEKLEKKLTEKYVRWIRENFEFGGSYQKYINLFQGTLQIAAKIH